MSFLVVYTDSALLSDWQFVFIVDTNVDTVNGLVPIRRQAINWNNDA